MRLAIKIVIAVFLTGCLVFCGLFVFFSYRGKALLTTELRKATQQEVSIGYFALHIPSKITLGNLSIGKTFKARSVNIHPDIIGCFSGRWAFDRVSLRGMEFTYTKEKPSSAAQQFVPEAIHAPAQNTPFTRGIFIKNLVLKDATVNFIDRSVAPEGLEFCLEEMSLRLYNLTLDRDSVISNFDLKARIPWHEGAEHGSVEAKGWFDLLGKNTEAALSLKDIDSIYLYPYYSAWIDIDKAGIQKAKLDFSSDILSQNNDLKADSHLELKDIVFKPHAPRDTLKKEERIVNTVLGAFKAMDNGKITLDFVVRTKMDKPEFSLANIKSAVQDKLMQARQANRITLDKAATLPGKVLGGTVKGTADITRALFGGTLSLGREIKNAFEVAFKKEKYYAK